MRAFTDTELLANMQKKISMVPWSGCWIWMGGVDKDGYGQSSRHNKNIRTHRLSWILHGNELKDGYVLMHSCDMPACVNPDHLSQVLQSTNNDDKMQKNRHRVASGDDHYLRRNPAYRAGTKCPTSVLVDEDVLSIRKKLSDGLTQQEIAQAFGVSRPCISAIAIRRTWKHI